MDSGGSQERFSETVDYDEVRLCEETAFRGVKAGDSRRIETVSDGIAVLEDYMAEKENAVLVLNEKESGDVRVLPYMHRFKPKYRDRLYARLKSGEEWLKSEFGGGPIPATMLTLTAHQRGESGDPRSLEAVLNDLKDGWDKFRRVIDRATEGYKTEVMAVFEPHESGYPHLHVLIFGKADPTLQEKVEELWVEKYGVGGAAAHESAVTVVQGRSAQIANPAAYLMKYLGKTTVRQTGERQQVTGYEAFSALLWVTQRRQFSCTAGLSAAMAGETADDGESEENWEFVGVGFGLKPGRYSGEEAEQILKHLTSDRHVPPPGSAVEEEDSQSRL